MAKTKRLQGLDRVAHSRSALESVVEDWSHSHGVNPDGNVICVPCMAELLLDVQELISTDVARTSDGKLVIERAGL